MKLVRSGLVVDHDHAAVGSAVFGRVTVRFNAEVLNCIDNRKVGHLSRFRLENADAVVNVLAHPWTASVDSRQSGRRRKHDAWGKRNQGDKVSAVKRQRHDLLLLDDETYRATLRLQQR